MMKIFLQEGDFHVNYGIDAADRVPRSPQN